jgi:glycoside/pentoside/hexuronide:cation symporter, GPH family
LIGVIADAGDRGRAEGAYFGWWNFATKFNLALAAGLTLPLLGLLGYTPGTQQPQALSALTMVYCLAPIAIKIIAALALYRLMIRTNQEKSVRVEPVETLRQAQGERG